MFIFEMRRFFIFSSFLSFDKKKWSQSLGFACLSDISSSLKRPKRISLNPSPKSRDMCPGKQIPLDPSPIAHP